MSEWRKVITTIILAGIIGSLFGFDFDEWLKVESLATIPAPAHPSILLLFLGLFLGFWLIPKCVQVLERNREYERFYAEFRSERMALTRSIFFKYLSRAYEKYHAANPGLSLPKSVEAFIEEKTDFPDWLPVLSGELNSIAATKYDSGPMFWPFARDLYQEIDAWLRKGAKPNLLARGEEIEEFHNARQYLSYFWNDTGELFFRKKRLRFRNIRRHIKNDERILRALTFLSLELHHVTHSTGVGPADLHYLTALYLGKRRWGIRERLNNPLLTCSEKWRL